MQVPYFHQFDHRQPPGSVAFTRARAHLWHLLAGMTIGLGLWYLHWRWMSSLNTDALWFAVPVAVAETLCFIGTVLFFHDIWDEGDSHPTPIPVDRQDLGFFGDDPIEVDLFITTYDETAEVLRPSLDAAGQLLLPENINLKVHLLDDGNRPEMHALARAYGAIYHSRPDNRGFKAGNLRNALFGSRGDFVAICDADTRVLPGFLANTLGYFRDPKVAWVQTPHWFYDLPPGRPWSDWLRDCVGGWAAPLAPILTWITGSVRCGSDPYRCDPMLFFDVIQRRRNRHGGSFCCGAASIHRREAVFDNALKRQGEILAAMTTHGGGGRRGKQMRRLLSQSEMEPFRYHVSEDIHTSIHHHSDGWRSVYHPQVEAKMLSPWSMNAWKTQQLKYAAGTFDIMLRANPLFKPGMPWRIKLHYAATFWSYLMILWVPVLLFAPVVSLLTGIAPIEAYSVTFFAHMLPLLIVNELAMIVACKGYDVNAGRTLAICLLPLRARALWQVLRGVRPGFPPTPKIPILSSGLRHVLPSLIMVLIMIGSGLWGASQFLRGAENYSTPFLAVNMFWLFWNITCVGRVLIAARWQPRALGEATFVPQEE